MTTGAAYFVQMSEQYRSAPRLRAREERELLARWNELGDVRARERLVEANMRHVVAIARKYRRYPIAFEDLLSEGALGLVIALDRFDPDRDVRLVTYASYWIRACIFQSIIREWRRGRTGLGMTRSKTFFRIRRVRASYMARYGEEDAHLDEMARELDVSTRNLEEMLEYLEMHDLSFDSHGAHEDDGKGGLHERLAGGGPDPEDLASRAQDTDRMRDVVGRAMESLDERERLVAAARLMRDKPRTLAELGSRLGVSRERARQIEVKARQKLGRALMRQGVDLETFSLSGAARDVAVPAAL